MLAAMPMQVVATGDGMEVKNRVVDRQPGVYDAAGAVDVELDLLVGVLLGQEEELGDDQVGKLVVDRRSADKNNRSLSRARRSSRARSPRGISGTTTIGTRGLIARAV